MTEEALDLSRGQRRRRLSMSLYWRAMLWIGVSLAMVTVLSVLVSVHEKRKVLTEELLDRLREVSAQQAVAVSDLLWKVNREGTLIFLQGIAHDADFLAVRVLDEKGRVFASLGASDVQTRLAEQSESPVVVKEGDRNRQIGTLQLYFSHARLETMQEQALWQACQLGLLQLCAVLLATALVLRALTKPLEAITDRMLALAGGDLASSIPFKDRHDPVGDIARAVEIFSREMLDRRHATRELELVQRDLEQRIKERTMSLRESEGRFHNLFDHSPLPKWVYSAKTLRFLEVNDAAVSKYGYSREEFRSMTLMDIRTSEESERLRKWMATGDRQQGLHWRHRRKDGHIFDVEIYLRDMELSGEPARLAVMIDITARKEAERQAQRFFDITQDVIIVTDRGGKFLQVSPSSATVLGYQPEEMVGQTGDRFILPEDLESTRREMRAACQGKTTRLFKCRYVHKGGHAVPLVWTSTWSEPDGQHFFIGRDMTEYERTEEQLRQSQKMDAVGQLTGGVAHDFNNIMMVIMANVEALEEEQEGLDRYLQDRIQGIAKATQRASDLTRQLLAFSRSQPLRPQLMNINDLVVGTGSLLRRTLAEQIEIDSALADDLWKVEVDAAQLEAALVNLSINARDAMPQGGRLLIETKNVSLEESGVAGSPEPVTGDYVMLAVSDTGTGMPPQVRARVFEPFFTTKGTGRGTGLGLSMVYGFIKQSNGHVGIYSEVGHGTTVRLYLPKSNKRLEVTSDSRTALMPGGRETILVVEDDDDVRAGVVTQLTGLGYTIVQASDGASAIAAFETARPPFDLLLTDVIMPGGINGRMLADEVTKRWPSTKVVFMSGYTENAIGRQGQLEEGTLLISKPFHKRDLAQILRQALGS
jgi:PAS domain S-box-containing protein